MKERTKLLIAYVFCITFFVLMQAAQIYSDHIGLMIYNGVFMACQFGFCLILVRADNKNGIRFAAVLMGISMISLVIAVFVRKSEGAIPGLCNACIYYAILFGANHLLRKRSKEAVTDYLTGLLDRRGLYKLLNRKIERERSFQVLYLEIENFKIINDNYGHEYGDMLIKEVTKRIATLLGDRGLIARIGGVEFVLVLNPEVDACACANEVLEELKNRVSLEYNQTRIECYLSAYIGISSFPEDAANAQDLIKCADIAMYEASKKKSTQYCIYNHELKEQLAKQFQLENLIKEALNNDYFYMDYQPQFALEGKKLRGFEALLRLKTPEGTQVSPGEFIPIAERGSLILDIDHYVLNRVLREFRQLLTHAGRNLVVSINVSAKNIGSVDFVDKVQAALAETGFPVQNLEIEITEYCFVQSVEIAIENIKKLHELGARVALDDFGTGYTSLSYVAKMPVNLLKIDKSLVDDIEKDEKSRSFAKAIISMGHLMKCEVISEGVELEKQIEILTDIGCDFIQGYVWGRPLSYDKAVLLAETMK